MIIKRTYIRITVNKGITTHEHCGENVHYVLAGHCEMLTGVKGGLFLAQKTPP
jgi:hypothetical protein